MISYIRFNALFYYLTDAVEKVADRLLGPFNIAMVVEPIDIKISEAIMSFQEHNHEISQKIFSGCGKPVLGGGGGAAPFFAPDRARRSAKAIPDFDWKEKTNEDDFEIEASFESLLNDDPLLLKLRTPEGIREATEEMSEHAKKRDTFLKYMRGVIDLSELERNMRPKRDADPDPAGGSDIDFRSYEFDGKRGGAKKKKPVMKVDDGHGKLLSPLGILFRSLRLGPLLWTHLVHSKRMPMVINKKTFLFPGAEWGGPALERLVRDTRSKLRSSRRYWSQLPALLCTSTSVTTLPCYNGTDVAP